MGLNTYIYLGILLLQLSVVYGDRSVPVPSDDPVTLALDEEEEQYNAFFFLLS